MGRKSLLLAFLLFLVLVTKYTDGAALPPAEMVSSYSIVTPPCLVSRCSVPDGKGGCILNMNCHQGASVDGPVDMMLPFDY